jgi:hypothetical protein
MTPKIKLSAYENCINMVARGTMNIADEKHLSDLLNDYETMRKERDSYKKAKEENDERFMRERDEARAELYKLRLASPETAGDLDRERYGY